MDDDDVQKLREKVWTWKREAAWFKGKKVEADKWFEAMTSAQAALHNRLDRMAHGLNTTVKMLAWIAIGAIVVSALQDAITIYVILKYCR